MSCSLDSFKKFFWKCSRKLLLYQKEKDIADVSLAVKPTLNNLKPSNSQYKIELAIQFEVSVLLVLKVSIKT